MATQERRRVWVSLHRSFVEEGVATDPDTGEERAENVCTLPRGTYAGALDVGGYQWRQLFVDPSKYRGEDWRDIPMLADREVVLTRRRRDADGNALYGDDGLPELDEIRLMPQDIKDALSASRRAWAAAHADERPLSQRAAGAREASGAIAGEAPAAQGPYARREDQ